MVGDLVRSFCGSDVNLDDHQFRLVVQVERFDVFILQNLERRVERRLRELLVVRADVTLVPPNTLPRFEGKARRLVKLYDGETAEGRP